MNIESPAPMVSLVCARVLLVGGAGILFSPGAVSAQAPEIPPAVVVSAATMEATLNASIENNTLDTKVAETPVRGGIVRVGIVHRTRPESRALVHQELTEIYQIVAGGGLLVTGGTIEDSQPVSDPPNLGPTPSFFVTQVGGESQRVGTGDVVIIPAGLPHRLSEIDGPTSYIIYRFEATAPQ